MKKSRLALPLCLVAFLGAELAWSQISETNGLVRIEAESSTNRTARTLGGVSYAWTTDSATPGFTGSGYIEAYPADDTSTQTVASGWETTSPQINYSVTFSNAELIMSGFVVLRVMQRLPEFMSA